MNILGLISSVTDPASRARILQYIPYFAERGESLTCKHFNPLRDADPPNWSYRLKKITGLNEWRSSDLLKSAGRIPLLLSQAGFDVIWQNRLIQPHHSFWEKRLKKPVVFDFDDAIWLTEGEKHVRNKIQDSNLIFAGNDYLAEYARKFNSFVKVIPTVVDTKVLYPKPFLSKYFTIGWIGTKSNFRYLESIKPLLIDFLRKERNTRLMVVSSEIPNFLSVDNKQVVFKKWKADSENELINQFTVGIMPLDDNEWTRGKCGFKMLQYMACGKPVIVSPVGTNKKILQESQSGLTATGADEWDQALNTFKNDTEYALSCGRNGRIFVEQNYSIEYLMPVIIKLLRSLLP